MRQETQHWNEIRAYAEIVLAGQGQTGLTVTAKIQRLSDGQWWNNAGEVWGGTEVANNMTEVNATHLPGVYVLALPTAAFASYSAGFPGYLVHTYNQSKSHRETTLISPIRRSPHDDIVTDHVAANSFGLLHQVTKSLVGGNTREKNQLYDVNDRLLTWTTVTYANATDAELDQNPLETFQGSASYTEGNLTSYVLKKVP